MTRAVEQRDAPGPRRLHECEPGIVEAQRRISIIDEPDCVEMLGDESHADQPVEPGRVQSDMGRMMVRAESSYTHIIITRFSYRGPAMSRSFDPLDPTLLSRRFDLFEATCLPSILGQTSKDFSSGTKGVGV